VIGKVPAEVSIFIVRVKLQRLVEVQDCPVMLTFMPIRLAAIDVSINKVRLALDRLVVT
jgi:hypothetical protein